MLGRRDKPRFHRFFRAAIISSSVTEAISPLPTPLRGARFPL